jgi:mRNA-degrading endonuclease YafQ of YafQ-DinJ toxin-antitoxin module
LSGWITRSHSRNNTENWTELKKKFHKRVMVLLDAPDKKILRVHKLHGEYEGYRSMDVTGDVRALFYYDDNGTLIIFGFIGTHSQLY